MFIETLASSFLLIFAKRLLLASALAACWFSSALAKSDEKDYRQQAIDILGRSHIEERPLTPEESEEVSRLVELDRLDREATGRLTPGEALAQREALMDEIAVNLGVTAMLEAMAELARLVTVDRLTDLQVEPESEWRDAIAQKFSSKNATAVYGAEWSTLEDLQALQAWLATPAGKQITETLEDWPVRMATATAPAPTSADEVRADMYAAIGASSIWGTFLYHIEYFKPFLFTVAIEYDMSSEDFDAMWSSTRLPMSQQDYTHYLSAELLPLIFASVDVATLNDYVQFQNSAAARRVFDQLSRSSSSVARTLLHSTQSLVKRFAPGPPPELVSESETPEPAPTREAAVAMAKEVVDGRESDYYEEAIENLLVYVNDGPDDPDVLYLLSDLITRQGLIDFLQTQVVSRYEPEALEMARKYAERAIAAAPRMLDAHVHLAYVYTQLRQVEKAEYHLNIAREGGSDNEWLLFRMADLKSLQEKPEEAVELRLAAFRKASSWRVRDHAMQSLLYVDTHQGNYQRVWQEIDGHFDSLSPPRLNQLVWYAASQLRFGTSPDRVLQLLEPMAGRAQVSDRLLAEAYVAKAAVDHSDEQGFPDPTGAVLVDKALDLWPDAPALAEALLRRQNYASTLPVLMRSGHDLNVTGQFMLNPLSYLVTKGDSDTLVNAVKAGLDVNLPGHWRVIYPLHTAARIKNPEMISLLLTLDADPHVTDHKGNTPLAIIPDSESDPDAVKSRQILHAAMKRP